MPDTPIRMGHNDDTVVSRFVHLGLIVEPPALTREFDASHSFGAGEGDEMARMEDLHADVGL